MARSESSPRRYLVGTGTPSTGTVVLDASMPGRWAAQPSARRVPRVLEHVVGHPVRGQNARLVADAERIELRGRVAHDVPVAVAAHHHADLRGALSLCHRSSRIRRAGLTPTAWSAWGGMQPEILADFIPNRVRRPWSDSGARQSIASCRQSSRSPTMGTVHRILLILLALATLAFAQGGARAAPEPSDEDFLAAKAAFERGQRTRFEVLAPKLAGHVLEGYVEYWQLSLHLDTAGTDEVQAYLSKWPESPLADRLRADYLKVLGKRADWVAFGAMYPPPAGEDVELACYGIQYRRMQEGSAALAAAKPIWFTAQTSPDSCEPLFAALIASGDLSAADRRARFRLAAEAGNVRLAQVIAEDLPLDNRIPTPYQI